MLAPRHLPNAPITEAVIEVRVKPRAEIQVADLEKLGSATDEFGIKKVIEAGFEFKLTEQPVVANLTPEAVGYQCWTRDQLNVALYRRDLFSFSRLKPYTNWDDMLSRMRPLWERYIEVARPESITRLGVRFINRISLPRTIKEFDDYLAAPPNIPKDLPQFLSTFLTRVVLHDPEKKLAASITQALEPEADQDYLIVLLDIDTFKRCDLQITDPGLWETLEDLHVFKNKVFFASITENALTLFQ